MSGTLDIHMARMELSIFSLGSSLLGREQHIDEALLIPFHATLTKHNVKATVFESSEKTDGGGIIRFGYTSLQKNRQ
jgi:hypothetical protein